MRGSKRHVSLEERFRIREIEKDARRNARHGSKLSDLSWLEVLPKSEEWWRTWAAVSAALDQELEWLKLFKGDDKYCAPLESGIPSLLKKAASSEDFGAPEPVDAAFEEGMSVSDPDDSERPSVSIEESGSIHPFAPRRAVPPLNALMRRSPRDLKESLARDLFDSSYFLDHEPKDLLPALCFFEVGVEDERLFETLWSEVYNGGPFHKAGKAFSFSEFKRDKLRLFHILKRMRRVFFESSPAMLAGAKELSADPRKHLSSFWDRFDEAYSKLTKKQRNAMVEVHVRGRRQTRVAKRMRISLDSLRDRLQGGEKKLKDALPELNSFVPTKAEANSAKRYSNSGMFDREAAKNISPVYRIDPVTGKRTQIPFTKDQPRSKPGVDRAKILAWSIQSTPVPDFGFTDYFGGLVSQGTLDRRSTLETLHDKSAKASFAAKAKVHRRPEGDIAGVSNSN